MIFLCPKHLKFEKDFNRCKDCSDKTKCLNYHYEIGVQAREMSEENN